MNTINVQITSFCSSKKNSLSSLLQQDGPPKVFHNQAEMPSTNTLIKCMHKQLTFS